MPRSIDSVIYADPFSMPGSDTYLLRLDTMAFVLVYNLVRERGWSVIRELNLSFLAHAYQA